MKRSSGFTLIELCLVTTMIGLLAAIGIPKFSQTITKSKQSATQGNLGALRSALSIYYSEMEGQYPTDDLTSLTRGARYIGSIPAIVIPKVGSVNPGHSASKYVCITTVSCAVDMGGWGYENVPPSYTDPDYGTISWGQLVINCSHPNLKGQIWYLE